jgi:hypothetical protein
MENNGDLPKSIVVVLVILAVAISVLGTVTVLNELNSLNAAPECYLTLEDCGKGYDVMEHNVCQTKLTSCCQRPHYLLQDNWGYTCQYVFNETYHGG